MSAAGAVGRIGASWPTRVPQHAACPPDLSIWCGVCCQTRDPLTGKAHAVRESSRKVAAQLLAQRLGALAQGKPVTPTTVRLTFHDAARDLLNDYRVNGKRSLVDVERHITRHLAPFFGGLRMADITTAHVREYVARRQREGAANATINRGLPRSGAASRSPSLRGASPHVPPFPCCARRTPGAGSSKPRSARPCGATCRRTWPTS